MTGFRTRVLGLLDGKHPVPRRESWFGLPAPQGIARLELSLPQPTRLSFHLLDASGQVALIGH
jgi:hypothetical protein